MGLCNSSAKTDGNVTYRSSNSADVEHFNREIWCASCRPEGVATKMTKELWMFQPDLELSSPSDASTPRERTGMPSWKGARNMVDIGHWTPGNTIASIPRGQKIVIYVHGFTVRYAAVIERIRQVHDAVPCTVVGFVWPGTFKAFTKTGKVIGYIQSKGLAEESAMRLRQLITVLLEHGNSVHLLGHSMGARMVLQALKDWDEKRVGHSFLLAASLPAVSLSSTDQYPLQSLTGIDLTIFHSKNDDVLPHGYKIGEFVPGMLQNQRSTKEQLTAMGINGPTGICETDQVIKVNVDDEVDSHHAVCWLSSEKVQHSVCRTLELNSPTVPVKRILSAIELQEHHELVETITMMELGNTNHSDHNWELDRMSYRLDESPSE